MALSNYMATLTRRRTETRLVVETVTLVVEAESPEEAREGLLEAANDGEVDFVVEEANWELVNTDDENNDETTTYSVDALPVLAPDDVEPEIFKFERHQEDVE